MNFGALLAGGTGSRMNSNGIPKQFLKLCGEPVIVHTLKKLVKADVFDKFIIAVHPDWKEHLARLLKEYAFSAEQIILADGGKERIGSIENILKVALAESCSPDDIILLHDAVRPFVSTDILTDSVLKAREIGACVAVVPATDTMYVLDEKKLVSAIPPRQTMFHGQSPDTFKIGVLNQAINSLTDVERKQITGTVQICFAKNIPVGTVQGSYRNIKITTPVDLSIAKSLLETEDER